MGTVKRGPLMVAIAGPSGSGKSWLAGRLMERVNAPSMRLSLDNYYRDRSGLARGPRRRINFDHPRAIDWDLAEETLGALAKGKKAPVIEYDFATHTRKSSQGWMAPPDVVVVEGLWLLRRPRLRRLFEIKLFIRCSAEVCLERRLRRDVLERGRMEREVREQFERVVRPMSARFVDGQRRWADWVLLNPPEEQDMEWVAERIEQELRSRRIEYDRS